MAIEKMKLMNVVLPKEDLDKVLQDILTHEKVEIISAQKMIDESLFLLSTSIENANILHELNHVKPYQAPNQSKALRARLDRIMEGSNSKLIMDHHLLDYQYDLSALEESVRQCNQDLDDLKKEMNDLAPYQILAELGLEIPFLELDQMEHFDYKIGLVHNISYQRLKYNAENIPPMFLHLGTWRKRELCMFLYPHIIEVETMRILQSVQFEEIQFSPALYGQSPKAIPKRITEIENHMKEAHERKMATLQSNEKEIAALYSRLLLEERIEEIEPLVSSSENYVYLSMWVPAKRVVALTERIQSISKGIIGSMGSQEARSIEKAPTLLNNVRFFRPFESLVYLYGTPNYHELDPTPFFAIAYMLLFGAMFGDVGQGLVFFLAGMFVKYGKKMEYGALISRLGLSSMAFGFFYDSLFGYEGVISGMVRAPIFIHPFENTNLVLIASIIVGLFLLSAGYIYSMMNKYRLEQYDELLMGKNGLAGFLLFLMILGLLANYLLKLGLPNNLFVALLVVSLALIILREPIYRKYQGEEKLLHGTLGEFITEQFFETFEMFLSLFSNGLSFIRVGAFALNHVGLFVAFHTLAAMIGGLTGSIVMGIVGNIVIIFLEGLIVFIQGLRLMYYELFSKYFVGEGRAFKSLKLEEK